MAKGIALYKLAVLGDGGVGKTAMVIQFALNQFCSTYDPTIEDLYRKMIIIDNRPCMVEVLDTAGQEEYTALREEWIRSSEGIILVYSISSRNSFKRIQRFHHQIMMIKKDDHFPILIIGNKSDCVTEREVSSQEGIFEAKSLGCNFTEISAKNHKAKDIAAPFCDLVRQIQKKSLEPKSKLQEGEIGDEAFQQESPKSMQKALQSIVRIFRGPKIYIPPGEGNTEEGIDRLTLRLVEAARTNHEKEVRAYIAAGAKVNRQPGVDGAAIHAASAAGHVNIVNLLLRKNAAVNAKSKGLKGKGISPLQIAAAEGHSSVVRLLLHKNAQIEQSSDLHGTALCAAVSRARVEVVRILLASGANVNAVGGPYGNALQAAAWVGNVAIIEALHNNGAEINARGEGNCTALQVASFHGNAAAVRMLVERGALIDLPGGKYGFALEAANAQNHHEIIKFLLDKGASFETIQQHPINNATNQSNGTTTQTPEENWPLSSMNLPGLFSTSETQLKTTPHIESRPEISNLGFSTISNPPNANIDIVFVHGLQGHPEKTWTSAASILKKRSFRKSSTDVSTMTNQEPIFWPYEILSQEESLTRARILTWGYDTHVVTDFFGATDQQNISQHGNNLMVALQQERKRDPSRPMIFVAHSLGGILVKVALDKAKRSEYQPQYIHIYESTKGIIFIGTPHRGSTMATWGLLASNLAKLALQGPNEKIMKSIKPNDELLENIHGAFLQMLEGNKLQIHSFYETTPMVGLYGLRGLVVPPHSAQVGHPAHEVVREINGNHSEICKFSKKTDPGYRAVFGAIEDYVLRATNQSDT